VQLLAKMIKHFTEPITSMNRKKKPWFRKS